MYILESNKIYGCGNRFRTMCLRRNSILISAVGWGGEGGISAVGGGGEGGG